MIHIHHTNISMTITNKITTMAITSYTNTLTHTHSTFTHLQYYSLCM